MRDEGELYGKRLKEAGTQVTVSRYAGANHGFAQNFAWIPGTTRYSRRLPLSFVPPVSDMTDDVKIHPLVSPWGRFGLYSFLIDAPELAIVDTGIASSPAEEWRPHSRQSDAGSKMFGGSC